MSDDGFPEDLMSQAPGSPSHATSHDGCADCGSSPAKKAPAAKKKGKPAGVQATKSKVPAAKKEERAGERTSVRDRQPRIFLKVPNFKLPIKSKAQGQEARHPHHQGQKHQGQESAH